MGNSSCCGGDRNKNNEPQCCQPLPVAQQLPVVYFQVPQVTYVTVQTSICPSSSY